MPRVLRSLLELVAPSCCVSCGRPASPPWCAHCAAAAAGLELRPPWCDRCGGPVPCEGCWAAAASVRRTTAVYRYGGVVADAVVAGKLHGVNAVWTPLGALVGAAVAARAASGLEAVTWVATDPRRRRTRGVDHAQLLAESAAAVLGLPAVACLAVTPGRPDRGRLPAHARSPMPGDAFRALRPLHDARVLLVDDVVTTGATAAAATAALRAAGARAVHLACVARAGARRVDGGEPRR